MEYAGDLITPKEAEVRDEKYSKNTDKYGSYMYYFVHKGTKWCIDATIESGKYGRLLNHSCKTPNCATKILEVRLLRFKKVVYLAAPYFVFENSRNFQRATFIF